MKDSFELRREGAIEDGTFNLGESRFECFAKSIGLQYNRFGFDQYEDLVPTEMFNSLSKSLRSAPDYIAYGTWTCFVEVKCSDKGSLKIKAKDIDCYQSWEKFASLPVFIFFVDLVGVQNYCIPLSEIEEWLMEKEEAGRPFFAGNYDGLLSKSYIEIASPSEIKEITWGQDELSAAGWYPHRVLRPNDKVRPQFPIPNEDSFST